MREWYANLTPEERKAKRSQRDPERVRRADRERYHKAKADPTSPYMIRRAAVLALNAAVRRGEVQRGPCEGCNADEAQGHHDNYARPLDVRWLCPPCHATEHKGDTLADFTPYEGDCADVESIGGYTRGDRVRALVDDDECSFYEGDEGIVSGFGRIAAVTDPESIAIRARFGHSAEGRDYMVVAFEGFDPTEVNPDDVEPA